MEKHKRCSLNDGECKTHYRTKQKVFVTSENLAAVNTRIHGKYLFHFNGGVSVEMNQHSWNAIDVCYEPSIQINIRVYIPYINIRMENACRQNQ